MRPPGRGHERPGVHLRAAPAFSPLIKLTAVKAAPGGPGGPQPPGKTELAQRGQTDNALVPTKAFLSSEGLFTHR